MISQRSQFIISPEINEYNKETKTLLIGGELQEGEEEEAGEIRYKNLFHLTALDSSNK